MYVHRITKKNTPSSAQLSSAQLSSAQLSSAQLSAAAQRSGAQSSAVRCRALPCPAVCCAVLYHTVPCRVVLSLSYIQKRICMNMHAASGLFSWSARFAKCLVYTTVHSRSRRWSGGYPRTRLLALMSWVRISVWSFLLSNDTNCQERLS